MKKGITIKRLKRPLTVSLCCTQTSSQTFQLWAGIPAKQDRKLSVTVDTCSSTNKHALDKNRSSIYYFFPLIRKIYF